MKYDLSHLGPHLFEQLTQALAVHYIGAHVDVFGVGADGGREATWRGKAGDKLPESWDGYGVLQSKYMQFTDSPKKNREWIISQVRDELKNWADPASARDEIPRFFLICTNVRLSPSSGGGIDQVNQEIRDLISGYSLPIRDFAVWHFDKICTLLEDAKGVREAYTAFTTPGDVLARLIELRNSDAEAVANALGAYTARALLDDLKLNLTQAGSMSDAPVGIADVFIDLLAGTAMSKDVLLQDEDGSSPRLDGSGFVVPAITRELFAAGERKLDPRSAESAPNLLRASRNVLIGGPGQGKSTVGQFMSQVYRANFLVGSPAALLPDIAQGVRQLQEHCQAMGIDWPTAKRWPFKIVLTDLADTLAENKHASVIGYMAERISKRSSIAISDSQLLSWLRLYPWFVVFDGLDEVPASSNRREVLQAVRDFLLDAASSQGDVLVLATTRPQGYNDDFSPGIYKHYELQPLPKDVALKYADRLLDLRIGADSDRAHRIRSRVHKAAEEEATARLLSTPLQTTILTLLVERLGQAPKDRWRLFSNYYRVIYQREQEKGGQLADLLQDYEGDINAIHYEAGLLLQNRASKAGGAGSTLTKDDLSELIRRRLIFQGHSEQKTSRLIAEFEIVSTDRLVFLAALRDETIGFEIRSLQEFMAGEALLFRDESEIPVILRSVAVSSHWRNTLLFAIGKIFAERENLRGEVVALCMDLNLNSPLHRISFPGSILALDIISDGVCRTQPAYLRPLASCACHLLENPVAPDLAALVSLDELGARAQLDAALADMQRHLTRASASSVALVLCARVDKGDTNALLQLRELIEGANATMVRDLIQIAWRHRVTTLLIELKGRILIEGPGLLSMIRLDEEHPYNDRGIVERADVPKWLIFLSSLSTLSFRQTREVDVLPKGDENAPRLVLDLSLIQSKRQVSWQHLSDIPARSDAWLAVKSIASFQLQPSALTLASAIKAIAPCHESVLWIVSHAYWPLRNAVSSVCGPSVDLFLSADVGHQVREEGLVSMGDLAEAGALGDGDSWRAIEEVWIRQGINIDELLHGRVGVVGDSGDAERSLATSAEGYVSDETSYAVTHIAADGDNTSLLDLLKRLDRGITRYAEDSSSLRLCASIMLFMLTVYVDEERDQFISETEGHFQEELPEEISSFVTTEAIQRYVAHARKGSTFWLRIFGNKSQGIQNLRPVLKEIGALAWFRKGYIEAIPGLVQSKDDWPLMRLCVAQGLAPSEFANIVREHREEYLSDPQTRSLVFAVELLSNSGNFDQRWFAEARQALLGPLLARDGYIASHSRDAISILSLINGCSIGNLERSGLGWEKFLLALRGDAPLVTVRIIEKVAEVVWVIDSVRVPWNPPKPPKMPASMPRLRPPINEE